MIKLLVSFFIGWNLGANDAANVFGTAVSNRIIRFRTAAIIGTVFVIAGALIGGHEGLKTYGNMIRIESAGTAEVILLAAGIAVFAMTVLKLPVSMTHCIIAGIAVAGYLNGTINFAPFKKVIISWVVSPVGAALSAFVIYRIFTRYFKKHFRNMVVYERFIKISAVAAGIYGSYSLGANNVANVVGIFAQHDKNLAVWEWLLFGGVSISLGIATLGKRVMETVGERISKIDDFGAIIAVFASSAVVHTFSVIGVPVSSSQAIVGAVIGVGLTEGIRNLDFKVIGKIAAGWMYSIAAAGILAFVFLSLKKYMHM